MVSSLPSQPYRLNQQGTLVFVRPITSGLTSSPIVYPPQSFLRFLDILPWVNVSLVSTFVSYHSSIHSGMTLRCSVSITDVSLDLQLRHHSTCTRVIACSLHWSWIRWILSCKRIG